MGRHGDLAFLAAEGFATFARAAGTYEGRFPDILEESTYHHERLGETFAARA
jgi:hypothetical protein